MTKCLSLKQFLKIESNPCQNSSYDCSWKNKIESFEPQKNKHLFDI